MTCHMERRISITGGQFSPSYVSGILVILDSTKLLFPVTASLTHLGTKSSSKVCSNRWCKSALQHGRPNKTLHRWHTLGSPFGVYPLQRLLTMSCWYTAVSCWWRCSLPPSWEAGDYLLISLEWEGMRERPRAVIDLGSLPLTAPCPLWRLLIHSS